MSEKKNLKTMIYDEQGKEVGETTLPVEIFGVKVNPVLMAQAVRVYLANQKRGTASTKTRAEVRGGGRKPWRQKGTGRARHGSTRSPIWVKGGVAHGPQPHKMVLAMSKKMKKVALFSSLSKKVVDGKLKVLDMKAFEKPNTKKAQDLLEKLGLKKSLLVVLPKKEDSLYLSFRNLPRVKSVIVNQINTYLVLNHEHVIFLKDAIKQTETVFLAKKEAKEKTVKKD